jgi:hypothetical protein
MPTTITTLFVVTAVVPISSGFISDNNVFINAYLITLTDLLGNLTHFQSFWPMV